MSKNLDPDPINPDKTPAGTPGGCESPGDYCPPGSKVALTPKMPPGTYSQASYNNNNGGNQGGNNQGGGQGQQGSGGTGSTFPMQMPMQQQRPPQQQQQQQCYNGSQYSAQQNAYCSNGAIYVYDNYSCQYRIQQQCPSNQCNTQQLSYDQYGRQISTSCAPTNQTPGGQNPGGNGTTTPPTPGSITATLTCEPKKIDLGESVSLQYSCSSGSTATGNGFTANNQSGNQTVTPEKPPKGATSITYGLTCTATQGGATKQSTPCTIEVNVPRIVLVAAPQNPESGKHTTLGWVTKGMQSCSIQSMDSAHEEWNAEQAELTNVAGTVKSPNLTEDTTFVVLCTTSVGNEMPPYMVVVKPKSS